MKTSTGFGPGGATAADVALMRRVVGAEMGVKAAGGVRDLEGLKAMVAAGATRVGASAGVNIVQESKGQKPRGRAPATAAIARTSASGQFPRAAPRRERNVDTCAANARRSACGARARPPIASAGRS